MKKNFNKEQALAIKHKSGPALVIAGAGTGKTMVLVERFAHLINKEKLLADNILLITFTNKASNEIEERIDTLLPYGYFDLWIYTFHGFCERVLRDWSLDIGIANNFKVLSGSEQWIFLKNNLSKLDLDYYKPITNPNKFIAELIKHFSRLKDEGVSSQDYLNYFEKIKDDEDYWLEFNKKERELELKRLKELVHAYQDYNQILLENNYLDFGDLIFYTIKLFQERPGILKYYQKQFTQIMIDEFQDTNSIQYELIKLLALPENNLMVVGDDDQAIYNFRGASLANIMNFKDDYPAAKEIVLKNNYRSSQNILDLAYKFIKNNDPNRLEHKLGIDKSLLAKGEHARNGFRPEFILASDAAKEIDFVLNKIKEIYERDKKLGLDINWSDFAILSRSNDMANNFSSALNKAGLNNQFLSSQGLYSNPIIINILSYLRVLNNYHNNDALFQILQLNNFQISAEEIVALNRFARKKVLSLFEAIDRAKELDELSLSSKDKLEKLCFLIREDLELVNKEPLTRVILKYIEKSELIKNLDINKDHETFSILNGFFKKIKNLEQRNQSLSLINILEIIDLEIESGDNSLLQSELEDEEDGIKIMTVHSAKGLEFDYVFLVSVADKRFPVISRRDAIPLPSELLNMKSKHYSPDHLEEERRLFYVALSRAKKELYLSSARDYGGLREKKVSIFINELGLESKSYPLKALNKTSIQKDLFQKEKKSKSLKILETEISPSLLKKLIPKYFSFSQISSYRQCPLKYLYSSILRIPSEEKPQLIFGKLIHSIFYEALKPSIALAKEKGGDKLNEFFKDIKLKDLKDLLEKYWEADYYNNKEERAAYFKRGNLAVANFLKNIKSEKPKVFALEKEFSFKLEENIIKGTIDRIDRFADGVKIIDYKTSKSKEKLTWNDKQQLVLYQIVCEELLGLKVLSLEYYYIEDNLSLSFLANEKEKEKLKTEILATISDIKAGKFPAKASPLCEYCEFNRICKFRQI